MFRTREDVQNFQVQRMADYAELRHRAKQEDAIGAMRAHFVRVLQGATGGTTLLSEFPIVCTL